MVLQNKIILFLVLSFSITTFVSCTDDDEPTPEPSIQVPSSLTIDDAGFYPEDIVIANNTVYLSGFGDGTVRTFDLTQTNPTAELFAAAETGFSQGWGLKSDGNVLLSLLCNADFTGGAPGRP